jgi:hypothetical protein
LTLNGGALWNTTAFASGGNCVLPAIVYTGCTPLCTLVLLYVRQTCAEKLWIPKLLRFPFKCNPKWVRWKLIGKLHFHMHGAILWRCLADSSSCYRPWVRKQDDISRELLADTGTMFRSTVLHVKKLGCVGFEALTAVVRNSSVFWDITACDPLKVNRHFGGTCRHHLQGRKVSPARNQGIPWHWNLRRHFSPKRRLTFNGPRDITSKKI